MYNYISIYSEPETTDIYLDSSLKVVILVVEEAISLSSQYYIAGNPQMIWTWALYTSFLLVLPKSFTYKPEFYNAYTWIHCPTWIFQVPKSSLFTQHQFFNQHEIFWLLSEFVLQGPPFSSFKCYSNTNEYNWIWHI